MLARGGGMSLSGYALSVFTIIIISAIADMLLPEGKLRKTAKTVFSLIITLTLISPIIKLVKGDVNIGLPEYEQIQIDSAFVDYVNYISKTDYEKLIFDTLEFNNIENVKSVACDIDDKSKLIKIIEIIYDKDGISGEDLHKYISEVKSILVDAFNVSEEVVSVSGG